LINKKFIYAFSTLKRKKVSSQTISPRRLSTLENYFTNETESDVFVRSEDKEKGNHVQTAEEKGYKIKAFVNTLVVYSILVNFL